MIIQRIFGKRIPSGTSDVKTSDVIWWQGGEAQPEVEVRFPKIYRVRNRTIGRIYGKCLLRRRISYQQVTSAGGSEWM